MRVLKWIGISFAAIITLFGLIFIFIYFSSNSKLNDTLEAPHDEFSVVTDSGSVQRGLHIAKSRGCVTCHGEDLSGKMFMDNGAMGTFSSPNLTAAEGAAGSRYTAQDWNAAVRYGIGKDGNPLYFMPSEDYYLLSDRDMSDLIAYLQQLSPIENKFPEKSYGPIFRMLVAFGGIKSAHEKTDFSVQRSAMPEVSDTLAYGKYLSSICAGCHYHNLAGGPLKDKDPSWPAAANLTPHPDQGYNSNEKSLFVRALREGIGKTGQPLHKAMPREFAYLTDVEINALWMYLQSLPPEASATDK